MNDLKFAFRSLRKSPGFAAVAILALALGAGASTAIFSVVHSVLLRPLPYPDQERLVVLNESTEQQPNLSLSWPNFVDWRARQRSFSALGVARSQSFNDAGPAATERLSGSQVSHDLFTALGVAPLRGRLFTPDDDRPGADPAVVIRESYWQRRFGGRDSVLGEKIQLTGQTFTVIGVLPDAVRWPGTAEVWVPLGLAVDQPSYINRGNHPGLYAVGRLNPGATIESARADLRAVAAQLAREFPGNAGQSAALEPLVERTFGNVAPMLYLLLGAAGFVLLIACANVASLQLARAHARSREFALRTALGAGRGRLIRQLLAESLLLGVLGCAAGLVLGVWALDLFRAVLPSNIPRLAEAGLNGAVLTFAIAASLFTSVAFGLIPALHAGKFDLRTALAAGGRSSAGGGHRWTSVLIVAEFALTCVLLVGAGLMLRTLGNLYRADPGFGTAGIATFNWALPGTTTHADPAKRVAVIDQAIARLAALPGVAQVGVVSPLPLGNLGNNGAFYVEGSPLPAPGRADWCERAHVSPGFFGALDIALVAGRTFDAGDTLAASKVAIVDADFAARYFPHGDAVGRRFTYGVKPPATEADWYRIVGVVAHIRNTGPAGATRLQTYVPHTQMPPVNLSFTVRVAATPGEEGGANRIASALAPSLRAAMREVDPALPVYGESTLDALFDANIAAPRLTSMLLGGFAALALLLAAFGLYGVLSHTVGQRTREIGVRMALGAPPGRVVRLFIGRGLTLASLGLAAGLLGALGLTRLLASVLYGVSSLDPLNFAAVAALLAGIAVLACWIPARRASRVDPLVALRGE